MNNISRMALDDTTIPAKEKVEWLNHKIRESIEYMRQTKSMNSKRASFLKTATITMSGIGAILLGLQISGYESMFRNLAFVLITIVTLANALEPFFNYRALWIEQEKALAGFHRVKDNFEFYLAGTDIDNIGVEKLNQTYKELRDVWDQHNNAWLTFRKADSPTNYTIV